MALLSNLFTLYRKSYNVISYTVSHLTHLTQCHKSHVDKNHKLSQVTVSYCVRNTRCHELHCVKSHYHYVTNHTKYVTPCVTNHISSKFKLCTRQVTVVSQIPQKRSQKLTKESSSDNYICTIKHKSNLFVEKCW